ncbi:MAG TPA: BlaI/MecI/CopY family transcriptional regulator [Planctomycetaceae bacterium]|nr:BlaI/MecI/CopY family transcriptional regulator [Planctomycetaceae bacterium]HRA89922.1 BlaI/MecI/CopY family transcriptional regulator [Planctomycetaceae bacterium]
MARSVSTQPTEVELQILRILWQSGGSTAREVHNGLAELKGTTYSTTVKMLSVMLDKGLVKRDESVSPQMYQATVSRKITQKKMLGDLIDKVYDGSALSLVLQALSSGRTSAEELAEVRRMVDELEGKTP